MSFAQPLAFLLLLAIPLVLLFHLFRAVRQTVRITTWRFWEAADRERHAAPVSMRKLQLNPLLVLQILVVILLSLALSRPSLTTASPGWPRTVLVIDTSASMKATDSLDSRFATARQEALSLLDGLGAGQQAMVLVTAADPTVLAPFSVDHDALREAIEAIEPTDEPGRPDEVLRLAYGLIAGGPPAEIHVFTDAAFPPVAPAGPEAPPVRWHIVGARSDNVGITIFEARKTLSGAFDYEAYVALTNFSRDAETLSFRLTLNDAPLYEERLSIPSGVRRSLVIPFAQRTGGVLRAEISAQDDLPTDNFAYLVIPKVGPLGVALVTQGNAFLEEALATSPRVELRNVPPAAFPERVGGADIVVLDRVSLDELPPGRYLLFRSLPRNAPLRPAGSVQDPFVSDWNHDHPATRHLELSQVAIDETMGVEVVGRCQVLAESVQTPLMVAWEEGGVRALFVGFDLRRSDFPMRVAFPLFIDQALRWLQLGRAEDTYRSLGPGEPIELDVGRAAGSAAVVAPDGSVLPLVVENGRIVFDDTRSSGLYSVRLAGATHTFAVSLLDDGESNLAPGRGAPEASEAAVIALPTYQPKQELWWFLTVAALLTMVAEAMLYLQRVRRSASLAALAFRAVGLFLVGLALYRLQVPGLSDALHVAFLLDRSDSVAADDQRRAMSAVQTALHERGRHDTVRLIHFGATARIQEVPPNDARRAGKPPAAEGGATDIAQAIRLGVAALPSEGTRRLLLISDGNDSAERSLKAAREARSRGIEIYTLPVGGSDAGEVLLDRMLLPQETHLGDTFEVKVVAWSNGPMEARLHLFRDGVAIATHSVALGGGKTVLSFPETQARPGFHVYLARVEAAGDTVEENNHVIGVVAVRDAPRILYAAADAEQQRHLVEALEVQHMRVDQVPPDGLQEAIGRLPEYDCLVLSNISALKFTAAQMESIERYVRDRGGGLIMLGGEESFGLGGYQRTPIEAALPVTMDTRRELHVPSPAMVLIIDRSGSMNAEQGPLARIDLAKEAAQLAVEMLSDRGEVGIITFDTEWNWVVPIMPAKDKSAIVEMIAAVDAGGGGTELFPALEEAYRAMSRSRAMSRHIVILSDGETPNADYEALLGKMAQDRITVSSVVISSEAGAERLKRISEWGRGRFYFTGDAYNIPRIFAMETQLASKAGLVEAPFRPTFIRRHHEILDGIDLAQIPTLRGYVTTTAKERSETLLVSDRQDPILAVWRYGLGRAAAFTSDVKARWGLDWLAWQDFTKFAAQLVRWTSRGRTGEVLTEMQLRDRRAEIIVDAVGTDGEYLNLFEGAVGVVLPDKGRTVAQLAQIAPGRYQATFSAEMPGAYLLAPSLQSEGYTVAGELGSMVVPDAPEKRVLSINDELLAALAEATGATMLSDPSEVFPITRGQSLRLLDVWPWLVLSAALLFLVDLGVRWLSGRRRIMSAATKA